MANVLIENMTSLTHLGYNTVRKFVDISFDEEFAPLEYTIDQVYPSPVHMVHYKAESGPIGCSVLCSTP